MKSLLIYKKNSPEKLILRLVNSLSKLSGNDAAAALDQLGLSEV
jgi:hypothetical protein